MIKFKINFKTNSIVKLWKQQKFPVQNLHKRFHRVIGIFLFVFILMVLGKIPWADLHLEHNEIAAHVSIAEELVGGLSTPELKDWLEEKNYRWKKREIHLLTDKGNFTFSLDEIGASIDIEKMMELAYGVGRCGSIEKKIMERTRPVSLDYCFKLDKSVITTHLRQIQKQIDTPVKNGSISVNEQGEIVFISSVEGRQLNLDKSIENIRQSLCWNLHGDIFLSVEKIIPFPTTEELNSWHINGMISSFSTEYREKDENRTHNIALAAKKMDNVLLMPGELFSFNDLIGPRDAVHGYKESFIIFHQEFVKGYGGGICQLVSTLYNAVLRGNFIITERHAHSLPVSYVPLGLDATVAYGSLDFQFINQNNFPVLLHTDMKNGTLTVSVYGNVYENKNQYKLYTKQVETYPIEEEFVVDPSLAFDEKKIIQSGTEGKKIAVYRQIWQENAMLTEEQISLDVYKGTKRIIAIPRSED